MRSGAASTLRPVKDSGWIGHHSKGRQKTRQSGTSHSGWLSWFLGGQDKKVRKRIQEKWGKIQGQWLKAVICLAAKVS